MTEEELAEIERREKAVTPGAWEAHSPSRVYAMDVDSPIYGRQPSVCVMEGASPEIASADADFIAHAREDVPALLAEIRRLRAALAEKEAQEMAAAADYDQLMERYGAAANLRRMGLRPSASTPSDSASG